MMKKAYAFLLMLTMIFQSTLSYAQGASLVFINHGMDVLSHFSHAYYQHAVMGNTAMIRELLDQGYPIDIEDEYGNSALCQTIVKNNKNAFSLLKSFGANDQSACMQALPMAQKAEFIALPDVAELSTSLSGLWAYRTLLGAAAVLGAVGIGVGIAKSGSSGSSGGGNQGGGSSGSNILSSPENPKPSVFQTAEYNFGYNDRMNLALDAANVYSNYITVTGDPSNPTYDFSALADVVVAVLDSGVKDHPDIQQFYNNEGEPYRLNPDSTLYEIEDHGTMVAGLIAGKWDNQGMHGIAPNARIADWALTSDGYFFASLDLLQDAIAINTRIVNMSLSFPSLGTADMVTSNVDYIYMAEHAGTQVANFLEYIAGTTGYSDDPVIWVLSAGNDARPQPQYLAGLVANSDYYGKDTDDLSHDHGGGYPEHANLSNLLVVAVSTALDGTPENNFLDSNLASYSNQCGVAKEYCLAAPVGDAGWLDPRVSTTSGYDQYDDFAGTSAASPIISGVAAFLMGAFPSLTPQEVVEIMFRTALGMQGSSCEGQTGETCSDDVFGRGMVNLKGAMSPVGETSLASGSSVKKDLVPLQGVSMTIPRLYSLQILSQLPKNISFLDEYARSFQMPVSNLIQINSHQRDSFKRHFQSFAQAHKIQNIQEDNLHFAYALSDTSSLSNIGFMKVDIPLSNQMTTTLSYQEDTRINSHSYFERASLNPFLTMKDAYGVSQAVSLTQKLTTAVSFMAGANAFSDGDSFSQKFDDDVYSFLSETSYQLTDFINIKAVGGLLKESGSVLGWHGQSSFQMQGAETRFLGASFEWKPRQKLTLMGSYYYGWTESQQHNSFLTINDLRAYGFAFDARYQFENQSTVGLMLSSPLRIHKGTATFNLPLGRDDETDRVYRGEYEVDLTPSAREYNISTYFIKPFKYAVFKNEWGLRLNPDHHREAKTDYRVLMGLDFPF